MNRLSALFQFIIGFFVGVLLLISGTTALAYVVFYRLNSQPARPTFAEEKPQKEATKTESQAEKTAEKPTEKPTEEVAAKQPEPEVEEKTEETEKLPQGAYKAAVNWPDGLSLRAEPGKEAERIGGIEYKSEIIILETSSDGGWQKVRIPGSEQEGWIKAGNVDKIESGETQEE
ncbi:SH3 type 3 domain-containing protein [Rippkaea orientalis PCC 8801]|uniref:SH3 type 3 domain-containing protein n=1 Tax=Rippkaea orientalis (strain PCC 8801 / RF-1) TaxID=41431 RepID=B7JWR7_RIPO1|nr:SH3 domain-containing protein [Rippkaea orientalis]ACK65766.1 SH3 type 3 domain-containing protein [Rippkaea orientalis PCC 8801]